MRLRCGGIINEHFISNLLVYVVKKHFENRSVGLIDGREAMKFGYTTAGLA